MRKKMLTNFEERIKQLYEEGKIRAPIHLSGGNEKPLEKIFENYHQKDWIFSTWRNHYHWLLSGRDPQELERQIKAGDSMSVFGERFFTSSIVGGHAPIALGVALAIKIRQTRPAYREPSDTPPPRVWCFVGDMAASGGLVQECIQYAQGHDLPITYIIEDNGLSVTTETGKAWGTEKKKKTRRYKYRRQYPHAGTGKYVVFEKD